MQDNSGSFFPSFLILSAMGGVIAADLLLVGTTQAIALVVCLAAIVYGIALNLAQRAALELEAQKPVVEMEFPVVEVVPANIVPFSAVLARAQSRDASRRAN
jgi:hypothetical protein